MAFCGAFRIRRFHQEFMRVARWFGCGLGRLQAKIRPPTARSSEVFALRVARVDGPKPSTASPPCLTPCSFAAAAGVPRRTVSDSQFGFLQSEFPDIFVEARKAEVLALNDSGTSLFYARRALEFALDWAFRHDRDLPLPFDNKLESMVKALAFKAIEGGGSPTSPTRFERLETGQPTTRNSHRLSKQSRSFRSCFCSVSGSVTPTGAPST